MPESSPIVVTRIAAIIGPSTAATLIDICCSATALASSRGGTRSTTHACRAGPISENAAPIRKVEQKSSGIVMLSVTISTPVAMMMMQGAICPPSTSGFFA